MTSVLLLHLPPDPASRRNSTFSPRTPSWLRPSSAPATPSFVSLLHAQWGLWGPEGKERMETPKSTQTLVSFLNLEAAPKMAGGVSNPFKRTGAVRGADQSLALSFLNPNLLVSEHVCPSAIWSLSGCHKGTSSDWEKPRGQWFPLAPQQEDGLMAGLPPCHKTHDRRTSWTEAWSRSALQCLLLTRGWERPGPAQATSRPQPG